MTNRIIPFRGRLKKRKKLILFICTGNTCRSPMAAGFFRKLLEESRVKTIEVRSAGVMTITGLLASPEAIQVMETHQVDLHGHRSTQLSSELIHKADLILAMTPFHRQAALRISEEARHKTYLFKEYTRSDLKNVQIADPMGCTLEVFKMCFKEIRAACRKLFSNEFVTSNAGAAASLPNRRQTKAPGPSRKSPKKTAGKKAAKSRVKTKVIKKSAGKPIATKKTVDKKSVLKKKARPAASGKATTKKPKRATVVKSQIKNKQLAERKKIASHKKQNKKS